MFKIVFLIAGCLGVFFGLLPATHASEAAELSTLQKGEVWKDNRIGIIVSKVGKAGVLPSDVSEELDLPERVIREMPKPKGDHVLVYIQLTVIKIANAHVVSFGGHDDESSVLTDTEGDTYKLNSWYVKGIKSHFPHDITGPFEFIEGARCLLIFEMPKHKEPANLALVYYYKEAWEDVSRKKGQIDIDLTVSEKQENQSKPVYVNIAEIQRNPLDYVGKGITIRGIVTSSGTHVRKWYAPPSPQIAGLPPTSIGSRYTDFIQINDSSGAIRAEFENEEEPMGPSTEPPYGLKVYRGDKVEVTRIMMKDEKKGVWIEGIRVEKVQRE